MPDRYLHFISVVNWLIDWAMTFFTIALLFVASGILEAIGLILMVAFWIGRNKKQIERDHEGSIWKYIKYLFSKPKKKDDSGTQ